jgi:cytochrome c-type biogenesis protein
VNGVGIFAALAAGLLSFLSPCVLPLIPAYLSLVSGYALSDIRLGSARNRVLKRTLTFVAGFAIVFTILGLLFSGASMLLGGLSRTIIVFAGILVIILGVNLIFDFIKALDLEARFHSTKAPRGYAGAFLLGIAFAAGWSPCVGPILASILLFAAQGGNALKSGLLLLAYSAGLALPFLAAGLFFDRLTPLMSWFKHHARGVRVASGVLLVALGSFMALGRLSFISALAARASGKLRAAIASSPASVNDVSGSLWCLIAVSIVAVPAIRHRQAPGPVQVSFAAFFFAVALGDFSGLWSTARLVAGWLGYQGA